MKQSILHQNFTHTEVKYNIFILYFWYKVISDVMRCSIDTLTIFVNPDLESRILTTLCPISICYHGIIISHMWG